ncbi:NfeD family protein [Nocardioides sp.]|uniref:NfeD family protein n=1 Tax=Nocardioides sp. TaxID=35761 RepID=UPI003561BA67
MDWLRDHLTETWLALAIVLGITEMIGLDLILLMLAMGALVGMTAAIIGAPFFVQALAAAGASVACLALVRPQLVRRMHAGPELQLGHGKLVGTQGTVTERITGLQTGRIMIGGESWSASPYDDTITIEPGETVEVLEIKGATAYVHPVPRLGT